MSVSFVFSVVLRFAPFLWCSMYDMKKYVFLSLLLFFLYQVKDNLLSYSQHKFASNVVEKCLQYGTKEERGVLIQHLLYGHSEGWADRQRIYTFFCGSFFLSYQE